MTTRTAIDRRAVASVLTCLVLAAVGALRFLSYPGSVLHGALSGTPLGFLAWDPSHPVTSRFVKILATPSVVSLMYFLFRLLNRMHRRTLDFRGPGLRAALVGVVTAHWVLIEAAKFGVEGFDMRSPLESAGENAAVLLASAALAFFGMRLLSFAPLVRAAGGTTAVRRAREPGTDRPSGRA